MIGGINVHVVPDTPRYQLPDDLPLPPAFRAEFNHWAAGFLGRAAHPIPDDRVHHIGHKFFMNPRTYRMMKDKLNLMGAVVSRGAMR